MQSPSHRCCRSLVRAGHAARIHLPLQEGIGWGGGPHMYRSERGRRQRTLLDDDARGPSVRAVLIPPLMHDHRMVTSPTCKELLLTGGAAHLSRDTSGPVEWQAAAHT